MTVAGGNLFDAVQGYPPVLLDREGIVGRFENDARTQIARLQKNVAPNLLRFRVAVYPGAEPSEARRLIFGDGRIPPVEDVLKALP
jgi:hypothetical protein